MSEQRPPAHPPGAPPSRKPAQDEPWAELRRFTAARPAGHEPFAATRLCTELAPLGLPVLSVASAAQDRQQYLMRPDLGRRLADGDTALLAAQADSGYDVVFVVA